MTGNITAARFAPLAACLLVTSALAADYTGTYVVDDGDYFIQLVLQQDGDGTIQGGMNDDGSIYSFSATPVEDKIMGAIVSEDGSTQYPLLGQLSDQGQLLLKIYTEVDWQGNVVEESGQLFTFARSDMRQEKRPRSQEPAQRSSSSGNSSLQQFLSGKHILFSYRDGGPVYGTYYFYNTHHCPSGRYVDYANSHKQSVLGGENRQNWQSNGTWQVTTYQGQAGTYYQSSTGEETFWPMRVSADGSIYINDTISAVVQGPAQCQ